MHDVSLAEGWQDNLKQHCNTTGTRVMLVQLLYARLAYIASFFQPLCSSNLVSRAKNDRQSTTQSTTWFSSPHSSAHTILSLIYRIRSRIFIVSGSACGSARNRLSMTSHKGNLLPRFGSNFWGPFICEWISLSGKNVTKSLFCP
jgi:hypothetical protein